MPYISVVFYCLFSSSIVILYRSKLYTSRPHAVLCTSLEILSSFYCTTRRLFPQPLAFFLHILKGMILHGRQLHLRNLKGREKLSIESKWQYWLKVGAGPCKIAFVHTLNIIWRLVVLLLEYINNGNNSCNMAFIMIFLL